MMKSRNKILRALALILSMIMLLAGCNAGSAVDETTDESQGNGKVMILYTSDMHCGVDEGFGLAGLQAIRENLESEGYETLLVDDGDAIQGKPLGMMTKGEAVTEMMNAMKYDVAIPGNHEFDYGMQRFMELSEKAEFPYVSCNFTKNDNPVFDPYVIKEAAGLRIAFVGITTPNTLTTSNPENFKDEDGKRVYGFMEDSSGEKLYKAVQDAVDSARADGADYVYVMGHLGYEKADSPYTYADVIEHTNGIDVFLDGHSHDLEQVVMKNKDGEKVVRTACGSKLQAIGYSELSASDGVLDTDIWVWNNKKSVPELMGVDNDIKKTVDSAMADLGKTLDEVTGQQVLDALEWGASKLPGEFGGFMQVSGLTFEIDMSIPSPCTKTEEGLFNGISGERRVKNVMAGNEALDPEATYTVAGQDYHLLHNGDGFAMFNGAKSVIMTGRLDSEVLIDYIKDTLGGVVGTEYADPYGQGRITIIQ